MGHLPFVELPHLALAAAALIALSGWSASVEIADAEERVEAEPVDPDTPAVEIGTDS